MSELYELEEDIANAKKSIALSDSLERLKKNRDFKSLFLKYFSKELSNILVFSKAYPGKQSTVDQEYIDAQLMSIAHFDLFMGDVESAGIQAKQTLQDCEHERIMYLKEEGDKI